jgi:hypothetical protein
VTFKKGDLVGCKDKDVPNAYVITEVVREHRFYFAYSIFSRGHMFIVHDPENVYLICPNFDVSIEPDPVMQSINTEMYDALDKLFGFVEEETDE